MGPGTAHVSPGTGPTFQSGSGESICRHKLDIASELISAKQGSMYVFLAHEKINKQTTTDARLAMAQR